jgi:flagellar biosynthesis protein FliR
MSLDVSMGWVTAVLLCAMRLSALLLATPVLAAMGLPARVRVILILSLSLALVSGMRLAPAIGITALPALVGACVNELLLGALMAFGIFCAFAAFSFAGNALDLQIGFNIANLFDPITRSQSPLIASLLGMLAVTLFFSMDAHHALLRGFAWSLERVPLGAPMRLPEPALLLRQFGTVFSFGLLLAAPLLFCLFMVELALAVLSRNLQQMNIFILSAPIKIAIGLVFLALSANHIGSVSKKIFDHIFMSWDGML